VSPGRLRTPQSTPVRFLLGHSHAHASHNQPRCGFLPTVRDYNDRAMNGHSRDELLQALAPALEWEVPVRWANKAVYAFRRFLAAPDFACIPLPIHWDGLTTAAVCLRVDLQASCVPGEIRNRLTAAAGSRLGADGSLYLLADASRSQLENLEAARDELARLVRGTSTTW
jgi:hypothetical protein